MTFFEHDNDRYYYFDAGAGTPIVLLHGFGNTGRAWTQQVVELKRLGHRVIVPDLLGHGASGPVRRVMTAREQGKAIAALLQFLGLESAAFIGLSLGGMIALEIAADYPKAVDKLIVAATFRTMATLPRQRMLNAWIEAISQPDGCVKRFKSNWAELVGNAFADSPAGLAWYQAWHAQAALQEPRNHIHWCEGMKFYDISQRLGQITAPTLILAGETDAMSPLDESQALSDAINSAERVVVAGGGHVINVSCAAEFNRHTVHFLRAK